MEHDGWVKIHRKIWENPILTHDPEYFFVWAYLITHATHKDYPAWFSGEKVILKPGQLITGRDVIAAKTKIHRSKVDRILKRFEIEQQIEQRKTPNGRLITIVKWIKYQHNEQLNEQRVSNDRATTEQRLSTNKNVKNNKNVKKRESDAPSPNKSIKILDDPATIANLKAKFPGIDVEAQLDLAKDWLASKGKVYQDYLAFARNWLRKPYAQKNYEQKRGSGFNGRGSTIQL